MLIGDSKFRKGRDHPDEEGMFAPPSSLDPEELKVFKSRVRCRHESFNGRMKFFSILSETFRGAMEQHGDAFTAIAVIVQYQMDNCSPIYASK